VEENIIAVQLNKRLVRISMVAHVHPKKREEAMAGTTKEVPANIKEQVTRILDDMHKHTPLAEGSHELRSNAQKAAWSITWNTNAAK
jgi:hypothetical protein